MSNYELTLILDSQLSEDQINSRVQKVTALLGARGAEVVHVERWGMRKLTYEIRRRQQGFYTLIQFRSNGDLLRDLDQACRIDEGIIRHMVLVRKQFVTREEAIRQEMSGDRPRPPVATPEPAGKSRGGAEDPDAEDEDAEEV
ncbi:MAG: 30S ribosomal protein S6 [Candidatus Handelsmanbacteria bacterium RIFCSPLOWO2_12_FULL_64_10]|uniref:Small ribosomal subunit protein bS6 n=1 Tax=Handelsmanbacteria sp. (strain RIFCSPLOWO2_12_FULL_64_10) TaxID=1817868 RepID=A0A1F6CQR3_HANXR|nr:MAG: 30S ribosomal protein S6 [Candidatus Handelsmanbacteria bacterium RIFCSPLOWO2_12_FULL_64_10]